MEDVFLQMIVTFIIWYLLYIIISVFLLTTIVYFTYRFWKMLLPKEENNIFISNAPMVWYKNNTILPWTDKTPAYTELEEEVEELEAEVEKKDNFRFWFYVFFSIIVIILLLIIFILKS